MHYLFEANYYRRQAAFEGSDAAALIHFRNHGDGLGLDPGPYFSTRFYKDRYPDWHLRAPTAVEDFLLALQLDQNRKPHPLFDAEFYRASYPDLAELGADALRHFVFHGDSETRSPSSAFDAQFYRRCYLPHGMLRPFRHYSTEGEALGYQTRPLPRDGETARATMAQAVAGLDRPIVLVAHEAQKTGVPILTLDLAWEMRVRGFDPVFLLQNGGPLVKEFQLLGPVFLLAEGWDTAGLVKGLPSRTACVVNTSVMAWTATVLARAGLPCLVLLHEMADYIRERGALDDLQRAVNAGVPVIASMPRTAAALESEIGEIAHLTPGIILPETPVSAFRSRLAWRRQGSGPVFIGAGHADRRKGFDWFLSAAFRLSDLCSGARFVWLGTLDDWSRNLADTALKQGLDLTLPGFVEDSLAWYRAADVYLLTSRQDPGPTTAVHAAAVGTPFVSYETDIGLIGLTEGIGVFVAQDDEDAFARTALQLAVERTTTKRRTLRKLVRDLTPFDRYVDAILSHLARVPDGAA